MCGIAGFTRRAGPPEEAAALLGRMCAAMAHRGPDGAGVHVAGPVALGHRRLSIIDLEGGAQPLVSADGRWAIVYNGEVYNYAELGEDLDRRGFRRRTRSDTEVLLGLVALDGPEALLRVHGFFAFALWDEVERTLLLARDHFGKKPLYYAEAGPDLVFASEAKAVLLHPAVSRDPDLRALGRYLARECVPAPETAYRAVRKLEPGSYALWRDGRLDVRRYYDLAGRVNAAGPLDICLEEAAERFRAGLRRSVERRLVADVPVVHLLSGGLDSSAVHAALHEAGAIGRLDVFTTRILDPHFDESRYADAVAERFPPKSRRVLEFEPDAFLEELDGAVALLDEPTGNATLLPLGRMMRGVREAGVKVALTGSGGDEILAGYPTFQALPLAALYRTLPDAVDAAARRLAGLLPASDRYFSLEFRAKRFLRGARAPADEANARWQASFDETDLRALLAPEALRAMGDDPAETLFGDVRASLRGAEGWDAVNRLSLEYVRNYLAHDILPLADLCGMAHSVEIRSPLLDLDLVETVLRLPGRLKLRHGRTKHLLIEAYRDLFPPSLLRRRKQGFAVPMAKWLRGPLRRLMERHLLEDGPLYRDGILRPEVPRRLVADHLARRHSRHKEIWTLLVLSLWHERRAAA